MRACVASGARAPHSPARVNRLVVTGMLAAIAVLVVIAMGQAGGAVHSGPAGRVRDVEPG